MPLLSIGKYSKLNIYPVCLTIVFFLYSILELHFLSLSSIVNFNSKFTVSFFFSSVNLIANILFGVKSLLAFFLQKKREDEKQKHKLNIKGSVKVIRSKGIFFIDAYSIGLIVMISMLLCFRLPSMNFVNSNDSTNTITDKLSFLLILFEAILSKVILKYPIYKHQILALAICCVAFIVIIFPIEIYSNERLKFYVPLAGQVIIGVVDTTEKYLMEKKNIDPCKLLMFIGLIGFAINLILIASLYYVGCPVNFSEFCGEFNRPLVDILALFELLSPTEGGLSIGLMALYSVYIFTLFYTLLYYSPTHKCIANISSSFLMGIYLLCRGLKKLDLNWLFGYLLVLLGALLYNEVIILEFCGLSKYTKREIIRRSINETEIDRCNQVLIEVEFVMNEDEDKDDNKDIFQSIVN